MVPALNSCQRWVVTWLPSKLTLPSLTLLWVRMKLEHNIWLSSNYACMLLILWVILCIDAAERARNMCWLLPAWSQSPKTSEMLTDIISTLHRVLSDGYRQQWAFALVLIEADSGYPLICHFFFPGKLCRMKSWQWKRLWSQGWEEQASRKDDSCMNYMGRLHWANMPN